MASLVSYAVSGTRGAQSLLNWLDYKEGRIGVVTYH
jgi:hypothetical protein